MKDDKGQTVIGSPLINGIQIICQVIDQIRDKKIIVFKKKEDTIIEGKIGHRQDLTLLKIKEIKIANKPISSEKNLSSSQDKVKPTKGESNGS